MPRKPPPKSPKNAGGAREGAGRPLKATPPQKAALDRARSMLRDQHEAVAAELIAEMTANREVPVGGGGTITVPDYATRQGAIDRITKLSGFVPDPDDVPTSLGAAVLDILMRPRS